jgi:hypothetical protein
MPKYKPVIQTPDQLDSMAQELYDLATDLRKVAENVRRSKFDALPIAGYGQMAQALKFTNSYVGSVKDAIQRAKQERGDFDSGEPKPKTPKKKRVRQSDTDVAE